MSCIKEISQAALRYLVLGLVMCLMVPSQVLAKEAGADEAGEEEEAVSLEETVKDLEKIEGLFTFYRNKEDGSLLLELSGDHLKDGAEYVYHAQVLNGVADAGWGYQQGNYGNGEILSFSKFYNRIEFYKENTSYYFDPQNALSRAKDTNIPPALIAVADIVATSEDGTRFVIDADVIFKGEALSQITPSSDPDHPDQGGYDLGSLNGDKARVLHVAGYERNNNIVVAYTFDNDAPSNYGGPSVTDGRTVTVTVQHSLIAMPEDGYEPRLDDYRVGYFLNYVTDLTDDTSTPYMDLINRWRLVKKDPGAALSEPVKPITYWIQNTTPVAYRDAVRRGALLWNEAFEKAGFKNAVVVKVQPDDADWDAGDVDHNVIRWVSSPEPMYGGLGPSLANPRTGEIIAADIMLEQIYVSNRVRYTDLFENAGTPSRAQTRKGFAGGHSQHCGAGLAMQQNLMFGIAALQAQGAGEEALGALLDQGLIELSAHEVGHTLGLAHNMKASSTLDYDTINSKAVTDGGYLIGSVMDYSPINVTRDAEDQGLYYSRRLGPYDLWAIEFGYTPALADKDAEAKRMEAVLARSTRPELAFGNDVDDMRSPNYGIDPRTMVNDLTDDPISYGIDRMELVNVRLKGLKAQYNKPGHTWDDLTTAYIILNRQKATQARVIANYIGGVYVERSTIGQPGEQTPYTPVPLAEQKRAMDALTKFIFAPDAWDMEPELLQHLQRKRRGWMISELDGGEDPKVTEQILAYQDRVLGFLTHRNALRRLTNSGLYGNEYAVADMLADLTDAVFRADLRSSVNVYRQNLQISFAERLIDVAYAQGDQDRVAQSAALYQLRRIEKMERQAKSHDTSTAAHRSHVRHLIETALYGQASRM